MPIDAAGAGLTGGDFGAAEATPGPANAANAAIDAMIAAPLFSEIFLAISLSLPLCALRANRSHCADSVRSCAYVRPPSGGAVRAIHSIE